MPDRYSFSSPFASGGFGRGGQPWFVLGNIEFTTTVVLIAINVFWMFVYAAEGTGHELTLRLWLVTEGAGGYSGVLGGEVWRIFTWPLVAEPSFWTVIGLVFFYIFGNQMEALMGRRHYLAFVIALTVIPALAVTFFDAVSSGFVGGFGGIDMVQFGVIIAFVAQYPTARFFFGIPAPVAAIRALLADRPEVAIVEDAACALGAVGDGEACGAMGDRVVAQVGHWQECRDSAAASGLQRGARVPDHAWTVDPGAWRRRRSRHVQRCLDQRKASDGGDAT